MESATVPGAVDAVGAFTAGGGPAQAVDPARLLDAPGPVRAAVAFLVVLLAGGVLLWRFEPFVERSMEASTTHPLWSLGYGLAAQVVLAFGGVYLASQLAPIRISGWSAGGLGAIVGVGLLLLAGVVGFTVVGQIVVDRRAPRNRLAGLLVGSLVAGAAAIVDPLVGGLVWLVVVATGIGGPVRTWFHASSEHDG